MTMATPAPSHYEYWKRNCIPRIERRRECWLVLVPMFLPDHGSPNRFVRWQLIPGTGDKTPSICLTSIALRQVGYRSRVAVRHLPAEQLFGQKLVLHRK
jgi:hypothetical protein